MKHCEIALRLQPSDAKPHVNLGLALHEQGRFDEAIEHFERAIQLDPKDATAYNDLGRSLDHTGRQMEALGAYHRAAELAPDDATVHSNMGAVLGSMGKLDEAIIELRQAVQLAPKEMGAQANLAQALLARGDFVAARPALDAWLELAPQPGEPRARALQCSQYCDRMIAIEPRLAAIMAGQDKITTGAECIDCAELCHTKQRFASAARFRAQALELDPSLAEDIQANTRYNAACSATLAGCGRGSDAVEIDDEQRSRWRDKARTWLRADLATWTKWVDLRDPKRAHFTAQQLSHWQTDDDMAGLREQSELVKLPEAERREWHALWDDVELLIQRARAIQ